jgi:hypothetical protein
MGLAGLVRAGGLPRALLGLVSGGEALAEHRRAPTISGVRTTPEDVAEVPITPWTKSGTKLIVPNIAAPTRAMHATLPATVSLRRRSNGRIGSGTRRSTRAKTARTTAAAASAVSTSGDPHGYSLPPHTSPSSKAVVPVARTAAPTQSIECCCLVERRGIVTAITASARPPTGRLT